MAINTQNNVVLLRSGNTDPTTFTASDAIECSEKVFVDASFGGGEYKRIGAGLNATSMYKDTCDVTASLSLSHIMRASNVAGTALETTPEYGELLKICGFDENIDTSTVDEEFVEYYNSQSPAKGGLAVFIDGKRWATSTQCAVGSVDFDLTVGAQAKISANISAFLQDAKPTSIANPTVTLSEEPALIVSCANIVTLGGTVLQADSVKISNGASVEKFYSMGGVDGLKTYEITDYSLTAEITITVDDADTFAIIDDLKNQTLKAFEIKLGTDSASAMVNGKSVLITATKAMVTDVKHSDDKDTLKRTISLKFENDASNSNRALTLKTGFFA